MSFPVNSALMRSIVGFSMIVFVTSVGRSGDMWSHGDRLGRYLGCGFGDGYHACRTDRRTPLADLPIHRPTEKSSKGACGQGSCANSCGCGRGSMGGMIVECDQPLMRWPFGRSGCNGGGSCDEASCDSLSCDACLSSVPRVSVQLYPARTVAVPQAAAMGCDAACGQDGRDGWGGYTAFDRFMSTVGASENALPSVPVPPAMRQAYQSAQRPASGMARPRAPSDAGADRARANSDLRAGRIAAQSGQSLLW